MLKDHLREPEFLQAIATKGTDIDDVFDKMNSFTVHVSYHSCLHELDMRIASISPATTSVDLAEEFEIALDIALDNITQCQHDLYLLTRRNTRQIGVDIVNSIIDRLERDITSYQKDLKKRSVVNAYKILQELGSHLRDTQSVFAGLILSSARNIPFNAMGELFELMDKSARPRGLNANLGRLRTWIVRAAEEKEEWHEIEEALFRVQPWIDSIQEGGNLPKTFVEEWRAIETRVQGATNNRAEKLWVTKLLKTIDKVESLITSRATGVEHGKEDALGEQFQSCRRSVRRISQALDEESLRFCDSLSEVGERILDLRSALEPNGRIEAMT
ncbi:hypothetical protein ACC728_24950 [Rhizobium ruizarguesonis]